MRYVLRTQGIQLNSIIQPPSEDEEIDAPTNSEALYYLARLRTWAEVNGRSLQPILKLREEVRDVQTRQMQQTDLRTFFAPQ